MSQGGQDHNRATHQREETAMMAGCLGRGQEQVNFGGAGGFPYRRRGCRYVLCFNGKFSWEGEALTAQPSATWPKDSRCECKLSPKKP